MDPFPPSLISGVGVLLKIMQPHKNISNPQPFYGFLLFWLMTLDTGIVGFHKTHHQKMSFSEDKTAFAPAGASWELKSSSPSDKVHFAAVCSLLCISDMRAFLSHLLFVIIVVGLSETSGMIRNCPWSFISLMWEICELFSPFTYSWTQYGFANTWRIKNRESIFKRNDA